MLWKLNRPLYGLRTAPKDWQDHFADTMQELGGIRLKCENNVYLFPAHDGNNAHNHYVMGYVDDLIITGENPQPLFDKIAGKLLLKPTGELKAGTSIKFLGRQLHHKGDRIEIVSPENYLDTTFDDYQLRSAKGTMTPGTPQRKTATGVSELESNDATRYRSAVGKLMWLTPIRPDIYYATKELSRQLQTPTEDDEARLKHLLRYMITTKDYKFTLAPRINLLDNSKTHNVQITVAVDSDWAGCQTTRKSTSGGVLQVLGTALNSWSRTQQTVATSSCEAELYAIGSGTHEAQRAPGRPSPRSRAWARKLSSSARAPDRRSHSRPASTPPASCASR